MRVVILAGSALATLVLLVAPATGAERFQRHAVREAGVSLAVPASWVTVDSRLTRAAYQRLARDNPRLAPYFGQLAQPSSPMKFIALDPMVRNGFATNANVVATAAPSMVDFAAYRRVLLSEIRRLGARRIRQGAVRIGGMQALRLEYRFEFTAQTRRTVQTLQYAFLRPGRSVVVTYTTLPSLASRYAGTFRRSTASIRFSS